MRNFTNTHVATTLASDVSPSATTITPVSLAALPTSFPFTLVISRGTASMEIVTVDGVVGSSLAVIRGEDGTLAQPHFAGDSVTHEVTARDVAEPLAHMVDATDTHGVGVGSEVVGTDTEQTLTNKTISGTSNTLTGIPNSAISSVVAAKITQPFASLAVTGAVTAASAALSGAFEASSATVINTLNAGNLYVGENVSVNGDGIIAGDLSVGANATAVGFVDGLTDVRYNGNSLPRGIIGGKMWASTGAVLAAGLGNAAYSNMSSGAVQVQAGRRYRIAVRSKALPSTGAVKWFQQLRESSTTDTGQVRGFHIVNEMEAGEGLMEDWEAQYNETSNRTVTFYLHAGTYPHDAGNTVTMQRNTDAGAEVFVIVEDIGPASRVTTVA